MTKTIFTKSYNFTRVAQSLSIFLWNTNSFVWYIPTYLNRQVPPTLKQGMYDTLYILQYSKDTIISFEWKGYLFIFVLIYQS